MQQQPHHPYRNTFRLTFIPLSPKKPQPSPFFPGQLPFQLPLPFKMQSQYPQDRSFQILPPAWLLGRYHDQSHPDISGSGVNTQKHIRLWYRFIKKFHAIRPESNLLLVWNFLVIAAIIFNIYQVPISLFFTQQVYNSQFNTFFGLFLNLLFLSILFINLVLIRPLTAFYHQGKLISSRNQLLLSYIRLQFWLNLLSFLSLFLYIVSRNSNFIYAKLFFYSTLYSLQKINHLIQQRLQLWRIRFAIWKVAKLVTFMGLVVVWLAGGFFAIDYWLYRQYADQYYPVGLWLSNSICSQYGDLSFIDIVQVYPQWYVWLNYSLYWALQTVSTVGYGDITPRNFIQVVYCDFVILILCMFYAFFISQVWQIFVELFENQIGYENRVIRRYEKKYGISRQMIVKLENFVYQTKKAQQKQQKQKQINQHLSDELKSQLILARQKKLYVFIPFFNQFQSYPDEYADFLYNLATKTKQARYGQNEYIYHTKQANPKLCLLVLGEVELKYTNTNIFTYVKDRIKSKAFFGVSDFLERTCCSYQARSLKFSKVSQLDQQSFLQSVKQIPKIHVPMPITQKYWQLFQQLKIYKNHELTGQNCWTCSQNGHMTHQCFYYFQWLTAFRQFDVRFKIQSKLGKNRFGFRQYFRRSGLRSNKVWGMGRNGEGNEGNGGRSSFQDKLKMKNIHKWDEVRTYTCYRPKYNI